jgi:hypothetical protein
MKTEIKNPPRCKDCRFLTPNDFCRRYPPVPIRSGGVYADNAILPKMNPVLDWCGEYKPKEQNGN